MESGTALLRSRATSALLPGVISNISEVIPSFVRIEAIYFAAACSFPGGFVVLILISCISQSWASLANGPVSPTSVLLTGIPIAGGFCPIWACNSSVPGPHSKSRRIA